MTEMPNTSHSFAPLHEQRLTLLVVDDDLDTLRLLCDALLAEGYEVLAARDCEEALQRLEINVPDGILLDAVMPGRDGFSLCEQIKSTPAWTHIPVVFMTGLSETEQVVRGFGAGGVDYVVKPLRLPEVMARIATHLRNARVARLAQQAVDVAGLGTVLLDAHRRVSWCSPKAQEWLQALAAPRESVTVQAHPWLLEVLRSGEASTPCPGAGVLAGRYLGESGPGESLVLLTMAPTNASLQRLQNVRLTPRESEVLSWLAKGKTNRDIADILGMSPRTVNKHLEHIFEKLGVETRSAAAAIAGQLLA
ncbi:DNA-binding response regulator [Hydrogenophaga sp. 5NK40-0174]|uniref:DNA-binding response regulator n=1 Tax=Hydrogenophaga sp. 5NK40-0174 TaxID=3127649 RepID=UPI00310412C1